MGGGGILPSNAPKPSPMPLTRRSFVTQTTATLLSPHLLAQTTPAPTTHPDVAAIDHDRILAAADAALLQPPTPLTSLPIPHSPGTPHDLYTQPPTTPSNPDTQPSSPHADTLLRLTLLIPTLASAALITATADPTRSQRYSAHAAAHLRAWFVDPTTAMTPNLEHAQQDPSPTALPRPQAILETTGLAELAVSIPFLNLAPEDLQALRVWFTQFTDWLTTSRLGRLARDAKDHTGSSWLLQTAAFARLTANDKLLNDLRLLFRHSTLRAQILADGTFPHELTTPRPYANSLFNLDLLAGAADLLSTRFESVWDYELQDGPGLRSAIARHAPYIADRNSWPFPADRALFKQLPCRRPALLFAARAFQRPDYATTWRTLTPAQPTDPTLLRLFPIRQPLLWTTRQRT